MLAIVGLLVFGIRYEQAAEMHWNITPIVGIAIAAAGNQIVTTVLVTYAVDSHTEHAAVSCPGEIIFYHFEPR